MTFSMPSPTPTMNKHEELSDWIGGDFDPLAFSIDSVNRQLAPRRRRSCSTKN